MRIIGPSQLYLNNLRIYSVLQGAATVCSPLYYSTTVLRGEGHTVAAPGIICIRFAITIRGINLVLVKKI